jgi:hypothetical protein
MVNVVPPYRIAVSNSFPFFFFFGGACLLPAINGNGCFGHSCWALVGKLRENRLEV